MELQERVEAAGTLAVGPTLGVHLDNAQVQTDLDPGFPVLTFNKADLYLAGFVRPLIQYLGEIEVSHVFEPVYVKYTPGWRAMFA
jgi:hypothetical protein